MNQSPPSLRQLVEDFQSYESEDPQELPASITASFNEFTGVSFSLIASSVVEGDDGLFFVLHSSLAHGMLQIQVEIDVQIDSLILCAQVMILANGRRVVVPGKDFVICNMDLTRERYIWEELGWIAADFPPEMVYSYDRPESLPGLFSPPD